MSDTFITTVDDLCSDTWTEADREEARRLAGPIWVVGGSGFIGAKLFFSLSRVRPDVYAVSRHVDASWRLLHCPYPNRIALDVTQSGEVAAAVGAVVGAQRRDRRGARG